MRTNTTKAKLAEGKNVFGPIISENTPGMVELFGALGYDFVMIDCEHGAMDLNQVEHMVRAAEVFGISPFARIPDHQPQTILRFLDRGIQGLIIPHVNTVEQATAVTQAARYQPEGKRSTAGGRPHDFNINVSRSEGNRFLNSQVMVIPMIEDLEAVDNLDGILKVPGIDCLHVASGDLGESMGTPGPAAVRAKMREVVARIHSGGMKVGIGGNSATDTDGVADLLGLGANFVTIQAWGLMRLGAEAFRDGVAAALKAAKA